MFLEPNTLSLTCNSTRGRSTPCDFDWFPVDSAEKNPTDTRQAVERYQSTKKQYDFKTPKIKEFDNRKVNMLNI